MDIGLLILRLATAAIFYVHATQKLFGWLTGPGLDKAGAGFEELGIRPGRQMAALAVLSEVVGATLVLIGLATPLGAAIMSGTMLVAGLSVSLAKGAAWHIQGGGEYPLYLAVVSAVLAFTGPGRWSLDRALGAPWIPKSEGAAVLIGVAASIVAGVAALVPIARARRTG
jgi:putative oxidoreductase